MLHRFCRDFLFTIVACCASVTSTIEIFAQSSENPSSEAMEVWLTDIDALDQLLRQHHPDAFFRTGEGAWQSGLANARNLARAGASDATITMELMSAVAHLGDGHTRLEPVEIDSFANWIPFRFYDFDEGVFVTVAAEPYADLIGSKVISIAGNGIAEVLSKVGRATAADNAYQLKEGSSALLSNAGLLATSGVIEDPTEPVKLVFEQSADKPLTRSVDTVHSWYSVNFRNWGELFCPPYEPFDVYRSPFHGGKTPMEYRDPPNTGDAPYYASRKPYWARLNREKTVLTFQFNFFTEADDIGWDDFRGQMWEMLDRARPDRFIIDLRYNFGGDGRMVRAFIIELLARPRYANGNRLVVLTGRQTFSAAIMLIAALKDYTDAIIVGEPAGAPLNHYGDPISLSLPSERLELVVSTLYWQLGHPSNRETGISVSMCVLTTASDYFAGRDTVWNTAASLEISEFGSSAHTCE
jgi:hypothetical protein